jgi:hypothetical protein
MNIKNFVGYILVIKIGYAQYDGRKLHFDATGWALVKKVARRTHKSPEYIVTRALVRLSERQRGKRGRHEKTKDA